MQAGSSFVSWPKPWGIAGFLQKGCGQGWSAKGTVRSAQSILQAQLPQDCASTSRLCLPASRAPGLHKYTAPLSLWEASLTAAGCCLLPSPRTFLQGPRHNRDNITVFIFFFLNTCVPHARSDVCWSDVPRWSCPSAHTRSVKIHRAVDCRRRCVCV